MQKIAIIDYRMIYSTWKKIARMNVAPVVTSIPNDIKNAVKIILPGVCDNGLIRSTADVVSIQVIAGGGAGNLNHLKDACVDGYATGLPVERRMIVYRDCQ